MAGPRLDRPPQVPLHPSPPPSVATTVREWRQPRATGAPGSAKLLRVQRPLCWWLPWAMRLAAVPLGPAGGGGRTALVPAGQEESPEDGGEGGPTPTPSRAFALGPCLELSSGTPPGSCRLPCPALPWRVSLARLPSPRGLLAHRIQPCWASSGGCRQRSRSPLLPLQFAEGPIPGREWATRPLGAPLLRLHRLPRGHPASWATGGPPCLGRAALSSGADGAAGVPPTPAAGACRGRVWLGLGSCLGCPARRPAHLHAQLAWLRATARMLRPPKRQGSSTRATLLACPVAAAAKVAGPTCAALAGLWLLERLWREARQRLYSSPRGRMLNEAGLDGAGGGGSCLGNERAQPVSEATPPPPPHVGGAAG